MKKISNKNYDIYTYSTNKFKTVGAMLVFINNVSLMDLIYSNVLIEVLTYSTKKYQTNREFLIACQNLFDMGISGRVVRSDNKLVSIIHFSAINPLYTNKRTFQNSVNLFKECIFNPNISSNHFDSKTVELIKSQIKNNILKNDEFPQELLNERLYSSLSDTNLSITNRNGLSYLDEINEYNLYEYYKKFLSNQNISMYLSGNLDDFIIDEFKSFPLISKKLKLNANKLLLVNDKEIHYINNNFNQNKISCLLRYNDVTDEEYLYTSMIFNSLFGELQDSLLMSNLREKSSLVYYIDSFIRRFDKIIMVNAGFSINNTNKVIKGIKDNLKLIQDGNFSESLILKAQESLISLLRDSEASQYKILNNMIGYVNFVKASDKEKIRRYKLIDKDKVMAFAKKVEISKIYILWEEQSGKEA